MDADTLNNLLAVLSAVCVCLFVIACGLHNRLAKLEAKIDLLESDADAKWKAHHTMQHQFLELIEYLKGRTYHG